MKTPANPSNANCCFESVCPKTPERFRARMRETYSQMEEKDRAVFRVPAARFAVCMAAVLVFCALAIFLRPASAPDLLSAPPAGETLTPAPDGGDTAAALSNAPTSAPANKATGEPEAENAPVVNTSTLSEAVGTGGGELNSYTLSVEEYLLNTIVVCAPTSTYYHTQEGFSGECALDSSYAIQVTPWEARNRIGKLPCPVCLPRSEMKLSTLSEPVDYDRIQMKIQQLSLYSPEYVIGVVDSVYVHEDPNCSAIHGESIYLRSYEAKALSKMPCRLCSDGYEVQAYYAGTSAVSYYHTYGNCYAIPENRASLLPVWTIEANDGKLCPYCDEQVYIDAAINGVYHTDENCPNCRRASTAVSWSNAVRAEKRPCSTCVVKGVLGRMDREALYKAASYSMDADDSVYLTSAGKYFHAIEDCSGMRNASEVPFSQAISINKDACPVCVLNSSAR